MLFKQTAVDTSASPRRQRSEDRISESPKTFTDEQLEINKKVNSLNGVSSNDLFSNT